MREIYYLKKIKDYPGKRCDVTPIFEDSESFSEMINDLIYPFKKIKIDKIVCLDALGFVLGGAMAIKLKKPLVLARKGGKYPCLREEIISENFIDYTKKKKSFEMKRNSIHKGEIVLIIDEWIETGAQVKTAIKIIEKLGGKVIGIS